jgi:hypothetical protein
MCDAGQYYSWFLAVIDIALLVLIGRQLFRLYKMDVAAQRSFNRAVECEAEAREICAQASAIRDEWKIANMLSDVVNIPAKEDS